MAGLPVDGGHFYPLMNGHSFPSPFQIKSGTTTIAVPPFIQLFLTEAHEHQRENGDDTGTDQRDLLKLKILLGFTALHTEGLGIAAVGGAQTGGLALLHQHGHDQHDGHENKDDFNCKIHKTSSQIDCG